MNWSDFVEFLKKFCHRRVVCKREAISPIWLEASRLSRSELLRSQRMQSHSNVQIAEGTQ
jgi:hypothetical protein